MPAAPAPGSEAAGVDPSPANCDIEADGAQVAVICPGDEPAYFDLRRLSDFNQATIVSLVNVKLDNLSALPPLRVQQFGIQGAGVADLAGIERWKDLRSFVVAAPSAPKLDALAETGVSALDLPVDAKTDLSALRRMRNLEQLRLVVREGSELPAVPALTRLKSLSIDGASMTSLASIAVLHSLEDLEVDARHVQDLTPVVGLTQLRSLVITFMPVSDLTPLSGLAQLEDLRISNTRVTDLSPLHGLEKLRHVEVLNTLISKQNLARFQKALPNCSVAGP